MKGTKPKTYGKTEKYTPSAKINHNVCFSIVYSVKSQRCDITPDLKGSGEGIIYCLGIQIRGIAYNPSR